jgi:glycosyltransferase involved in cell wall biosynthesis
MENKKKIIFIVKNLNIGGVQKSLVNFVNQLVESYEVYLYTLEGKGVLENELSQSVKISYGNERVAKYVDFISTHRKNIYKDLKKVLKKIFYKTIEKLGLKGHFETWTLRDFPNLKEYDIAISYTGYPGIWDEIVIAKIKAEKKIVWIHNNPYELGIDKLNAFKYYNRFDAIMSVSEDCKEKFNHIVPNLIYKNHLIYNIINETEIKEKSLEKSPYQTNNFVISTVARIQNSSKRFDRIISCCELLIKEGYRNFEWHIIGDGPDMNWLKEKISSQNLTQYLVTEGYKLNPYPYIINSNLFVLASDYEGLPVTLMEAKLLGVPVVVTNFDCAKEAVNDGFDGFIVEKEAISLFQKIALLLVNKDEYCRIKKNVAAFENEPGISLEKFNQLIEA